MACLKVRKREGRGGVREDADVAVRRDRINLPHSRSAPVRLAVSVRRAATVHRVVTADPDATARCRATTASRLRVIAGTCRPVQRPARSGTAGRDAVDAVVTRVPRTTSERAQPA